MDTAIERETSLDNAENIIDLFFQDEGMSVETNVYGTPLSSTVATIAFADPTQEPSIGSGKGYEMEARVGAKYEAYEHHQGLIALRKNRLLAPISSVINQAAIKDLLPLRILMDSEPSKIAVIPFDHPFDENEDKFLHPAFLIDYRYDLHKMSGDDADYKAAKRYTSGSGIAIGVGYKEAAIHAISEVIERHCVGTFLAHHFFYGKENTLYTIAPESMPESLQKTWTDAETCLDAEIQVIDVRCNNLPAVFVAYCKQPLPYGVHLLGAGCSLYPSHAANRAIKELIQLYSVTKSHDDAKNDLSRYVKHLEQYPKLLRCFMADMSHKDVVVKNIEPDPKFVSLDEHQSILLNTCWGNGYPLWIKEIHHNKNDISIACAVMPRMERFTLVSTGNYVIPVHPYEE